MDAIAQDALLTIDSRSPLGLYGNREIFAKHLADGFTECAFGRGAWVNEHSWTEIRMRVIGAWMFFHPDGRITTYEHNEHEDLVSGFLDYPNADEHTHTSESFAEWCATWRIALSDRLPLADVCAEYDRHHQERYA